MNERIKELKELASKALKQPDTDNDGLTVFDNDELEKFTELIVKECMNVLAESREVRQTAYYYRNRIAKHFGVEE